MRVREAVGRAWSASPAARGGRRVREVGPDQVGRIVLRRARARPQPTLAGYTRRSWVGATFASGAECSGGPDPSTARSTGYAPEPGREARPVGRRRRPRARSRSGSARRVWPSGLSSKLRSSSRTRSFGSVLATHHAGLMSLMSQIAMS